MPHITRAAAQPPVRLKRHKTADIIRRAGTPYLFIAPFMVIFFIFTVLPVAISICLSFTYFNILEPPRFVGWNNYINLFLADDVFVTAVKNTFIMAAITGPVGYIASFVFAWLINELRPKLRALMVVVFYAPTLAGNAYVIWGSMFSGDAYGYVNGFLMKLGFINEPIQWMQDSSYVMGVVLLVILWMSLGTSFLAFIAGLQGIDDSQFEAACIDGMKNRWQELYYITLPNMKPMLLFGAVMAITQSFAISDVTVQLAGFPSVDYAVHTVVNHLSDYGNLRFEMGYACAIATILFIVMILTNKLVQRLLRNVGR